MSQDPNKRPNGVHFNCRSGPLPPITPEEAAARGQRMLAFALFRDAFVRQIVEQRELAAERAAGIVPGDPNAPGSWEVLERLLGKETVNNMRRKPS